MRIGELVRELDTARAGRPPLNNSSQRREELSKAEAVAQAGLTVPTAYRYQELAGPRDDEGRLVPKSGKKAEALTEAGRIESPTSGNFAGRAAAFNFPVAGSGSPTGGTSKTLSHRRDEVAKIEAVALPVPRPGIVGPRVLLPDSGNKQRRRAARIIPSGGN